MVKGNMPSWGTMHNAQGISSQARLASYVRHTPPPNATWFSSKCAGTDCTTPLLVPTCTLQCTSPFLAADAQNSDRSFFPPPAQVVVDIVTVYKGERVVIEVDGPSHFTRSVPRRVIGSTAVRDMWLAAMGLRVASVPFYEFSALPRDGSARRCYLEAKLDALLEENVPTTVQSSAAANPRAPLQAPHQTRRRRKGLSASRGSDKLIAD